MNALSSFTVLVTTRVTQLAAINLMALAMVVLGLAVCGFAPALTACFWATSRLEDHSTADLVRGMWQQYKAEFLRANLVATPAFAGCVVLGVVALFAAGPFAAMAVALAVMLAAFALAACVTLATLSGSVADGWANATTAFALAPYRVLAAVVLVPIIMLAVAWQPLLGLYFGLSFWALLSLHIIRPGLASAIPTTKEVAP